MHRVFYGFSLKGKDVLEICDLAQVHHIKNVLRLKKNDSLVVCDGQGFEYICDIFDITSGCVSVKVRSCQPIDRTQEFKLTVACAIPKKSRFEDIVDKLTQLGVDRIIPLKTSRVIVKLDKHKEFLRYKRWEKVAFSASQQSLRNILPVIDNVKSMKEVLSESCGYELKLIPTLEEGTIPLRQVLDGCTARNILVLIGPEGDFSPEEVSSAKQSGCIPVSLGKLILRVETAAAAIASILSYACY